MTTHQRSPTIMTVSYVSADDTRDWDGTCCQLWGSVRGLYTPYTLIGWILDNSMPPIAIDQHRDQTGMRSVPSSIRLSPEHIVSGKRPTSRSGTRKSQPFRNDSISVTSSLSSSFKKDRSFNARGVSKGSLGGSSESSLVGFYSSRRSLDSLRTSNKSLGNSSRRSLGSLYERSTGIWKAPILDSQNRGFDESWNKKSGQKPDISPRRPSKRSSIVLESGKPSRMQQGNSVDTAPRQPSPRRHSIEFNVDDETTVTLNSSEYPDNPFRRRSWDNASPKLSQRRLSLDCYLDRDGLESADSSPRHPRQILANSTFSDQEIFVVFPTSGSAKTDEIPKRPEQRKSIFQASQSQEESPSNPSLSVTSKREDIIVNFSERGDTFDSAFGPENNSSGNSVTSDLTSLSVDEKQYSRLRMTSTPRLSAVYQKNLSRRGQASQRCLDDMSFVSRDSRGSIMSTQSNLSLSPKIRSMLELAADVVNAENLEVASMHYQKAIHAAGSEIMSINIQMGNMLDDHSSSSAARRSSCHEDLRLIGVIIGMLRTKMAILHVSVSDYERVIDLCKGAVQVHMHQPVLKSISPNLSEMEDVAGLMVLIIERLENAQTCFEGHKELLEKIDQYSTSNADDISSSSKRIVLDMLEKSSIPLDSDALEVLSVHTVKQDKHDEGTMYLRDALQIHLVALGLKHPRTSKSLLHVAQMYRGSGNDRDNESLVLGYFQETAAILHRSNLSQQSRVAILNDIAVIHMRRNVYDEAIRFLLDALHAYDEIADENSEKRGHHIATLQVWRNLGECYMQLFKFKSAEGAFLKALHIQRDCIKIQETAEKMELNAMKVSEPVLKLANDTYIAHTICRIGKARAGGGNHKQALDVYREALRVLNRNSSADKNRSDQELLEKRDQLTQLLFCIAESERATNDNEKSLQMYNLSLRLRRSNGAEHRDKRTATRLHCLSCFLGIIDIYVKQRRFDEAKNEIKAALTYAVNYQVKQTHPIILAIRKKAKDCEQAINDAAMGFPDVDGLERKADAEIERGSLDMATETLKQLLVIRRATLKHLKEKGHDTKDQVYAIACLLQTFGFVFAKNGDDENAERAFKDASRLFRKGGATGGGKLTEL
jgi:tetratricopeptide (TPR) repeat protein